MEESKKNFKKIMVEKIDKGEEISEEEIAKLVYGCEICREEGDCGRWTQDVFSVVKLYSRYFGIHWDKGLADCQNDVFYGQPYEVEKDGSNTKWVEVEK